MFIIPSIYIRDHKTVALATGGTIYNEDPVEMAKELESVGAELLYIVDLNAPPTGNVQHLPIIEKIVKETGLKIQVAAHIRAIDVVERYIGAGAERFVPGVIAYQKPDFLKKLCEKFPGKIAVHIEVRAGKVVITGWTVAAKKTALDYAEQFKDAGAATILYSNLKEEGKITISDTVNVRDFIKGSPLPVIHTSDVSSISELELIMSLQSNKLIGTIIGKSMYAGLIDISSTITHVKEKGPSGMDEPTLVP